MVSQNVEEFLSWVEAAYGKPVSSLCAARITTMDEFNPDEVLGECYTEYSQSMVDAVRRTASIRYNSRVRIRDEVK